MAHMNLGAVHRRAREPGPGTMSTSRRGLRQLSDGLARRIGSRRKLGWFSHSRALSWPGAKTTMEHRRNSAAVLHTLTAPTLTINYVREVRRNMARLDLRTGSPNEAWPFARSSPLAWRPGRCTACTDHEPAVSDSRRGRSWLGR
jgi:hypothetical protein